ncbi:MAG: Transposase DDE domain protein [Syntrophaceae bacterium PtaB.Bin095]|nr:MAG: Transposase DDE domain protein [Syntrophaceae bacterium PtaB.Bin095]
MYVRTISRKNKDGSTTTYVQLAHNARDAQTGQPRADVLYTFGRADSLDIGAIRRLTRSLSRFLTPEDALKIQGTTGSEAPFRFLRSVPLGGAYLLRVLWEQLGIPEALAQCMKDRSFTSPVEWAAFAMVANRALAPDSKRGVEEWVRDDVALGNPEPIELQHLYRAMDVLLEYREIIHKEVYFAVADLLNLEVDLIFFDTTSTYFETDEEDEDGLRRYGHSKDHRPDLPQVVIGLAVTKEGIPVKCWTMPGNTSDMKTVETVKKDLLGWKLGRCIWVMDRGMSSEENRLILQKAGGHYIIGEKLRDSQEVHKEVLAKRGRFAAIRENLEIKEVVVGDGERRRRFILVHNPEEARKDKATREKTIQKVEEALKSVREQRGQCHKKSVCALLSHRTMGRYLRQLKTGAIKIDRGKIKQEAHLDGKYILSTSDDTLSPEDIALGYRQLMEVERAFRTLKTTLDLRPVYHRKDERIQSHVFLCFLALLLVRIAERKTSMTWENIKAQMSRLHLGEFFSKDGRVLQTTEPTPEQLKILKQLKISPPQRIRHIQMTP